MQRKILISMKLKVLGILVGLVLTALGTYLFFALDMFSKDKTAYIYESGLSTAETLTEQVISLVNHALNSSFSYAIIGTNNQTQAQALIELDSNILLFAILESSPDGTVKEKVRFANQKTISELTDIYSLGQDFFKSIDVQTLIHLDLLKDKNHVIYNLTQTLGVPALGLLIARDGELYLNVLALTKISDNFNKDQIYNNFLLTDSGESLIKIANQKFIPAEEKYIQEILAGEISRGTREVTDSQNTVKLVAFNRIKELGLNIISEISTTKAFTAKEYLLKRSIFFGTLLIGISIFLGVIFAVSITKPIQDLLKGTLEIARGNFTNHVTVKTNDEIGVLSDSFNFMSAEISRLMQNEIQKARMEKELETAKTVQETLFPPLTSQLSNVEIAGHFQPASECGGDWWYYSQIGRKVFYWIGDATGHGVPAALITSAARSAAAIIENMPGVTPKQALKLLNNAICQTSKGQMLMTFFIGSFDLDTNIFTYANASHNSPFLFKFDDPDLSVKTMEPLDQVNGPRLGQDIKSEFDEISIDLKKNHAILFYTDGVSELENAKKEQLGERKFLKSVVNSIKGSSSSNAAIEKILSDLNSYREDTPLNDDVTFFITRIT